MYRKVWEKNEEKIYKEQILLMIKTRSYMRNECNVSNVKIGHMKIAPTKIIYTFSYIIHNIV